MTDDLEWIEDQNNEEDLLATTNLLEPSEPLTSVPFLNPNENINTETEKQIRKSPVKKLPTGKKITIPQEEETQDTFFDFGEGNYEPFNLQELSAGLNGEDISKKTKEVTFQNEEEPLINKKKSKGLAKISIENMSPFKTSKQTVVPPNPEILEPIPNANNIIINKPKIKQPVKQPVKQKIKQPKQKNTAKGEKKNLTEIRLAKKIFDDANLHGNTNCAIVIQNFDDARGGKMLNPYSGKYVSTTSRGLGSKLFEICKTVVNGGDTDIFRLDRPFCVQHQEKILKGINPLTNKKLSENSALLRTLRRGCNQYLPSSRIVYVPELSPVKKRVKTSNPKPRKAKQPKQPKNPQNVEPRRSSRNKPKGPIENYPKLTTQYQPPSEPPLPKYLQNVSSEEENIFAQPKTIKQPQENPLITEIDFFQGTDNRDISNVKKSIQDDPFIIDELQTTKNLQKPNEIIYPQDLDATNEIDAIFAEPEKPEEELLFGEPISSLQSDVYVPPKKIIEPEEELLFGEPISSLQSEVYVPPKKVVEAPIPTPKKFSPPKFTLPKNSLSDLLKSPLVAPISEVKNKTVATKSSLLPAVAIRSASLLPNNSENPFDKNLDYTTTGCVFDDFTDFEDIHVLGTRDSVKLQKHQAVALKKFMNIVNKRKQNDEIDKQRLQTGRRNIPKYPFKGILGALQTGSGKTLLAWISALCVFADKKSGVDKIFIVTKSQIQDQIIKALSQYFNSIVENEFSVKKRNFSDVKKDKVIVTTYESFKNIPNIDELLKTSLLIFDEGHTIKKGSLKVKKSTKKKSKKGNDVEEVINLAPIETGYILPARDKAKLAKYVIILTATPYSNGIRDMYSLIELLYDNPDAKNETFEMWYNKKYPKLNIDNVELIFTGAKIYASQYANITERSFEQISKKVFWYQPDTNSTGSVNYKNFFKYEVFVQKMQDVLNYLNANEKRSTSTAVAYLTDLYKNTNNNSLNLIDQLLNIDEFRDVICYFKFKNNENFPNIQENVFEEVDIKSDKLDNFNWLGDGLSHSVLDKRILNQKDSNGDLIANPLEIQMAQISLTPTKNKTNFFEKALRNSFQFDVPIQPGENRQLKIQKCYKDWYDMYVWSERYDFSSYIIGASLSLKYENEEEAIEENGKAAFYIETRLNANVLKSFNIVKKLIPLKKNNNATKSTASKASSKKLKLAEIFAALEQKTLPKAVSAAAINKMAENLNYPSYKDLSLISPKLVRTIGQIAKIFISNCKTFSNYFGDENIRNQYIDETNDKFSFKTDIDFPQELKNKFLKAVIYIYSIDTVDFLKYIKNAYHRTTSLENFIIEILKEYCDENPYYLAPYQMDDDDYNSYKNKIRDLYISKFSHIGFLGGSGTITSPGNIIANYNESNIHYLIITDKSNTGLDLRGTTFLFVQDLVWTFSEFSQIKGRGARLNSHKDNEDKNFWTIIPVLTRHYESIKNNSILIKNWNYFISSSDRKTNDNIPTADIFLYISLLQKKIGGDIAEYLLQEWSNDKSKTIFIH